MHQINHQISLIQKQQCERIDRKFPSEVVLDYAKWNRNSSSEFKSCRIESSATIRRKSSSNVIKAAIGFRLERLTRITTLSALVEIGRPEWAQANPLTRKRAFETAYSCEVERNVGNEKQNLVAPEIVKAEGARCWERTTKEVQRPFEQPSESFRFGVEQIAVYFARALINYISHKVFNRLYYSLFVKNKLTNVFVSLMF